mmetsp:Transcript_6318/g.14806  ORF Transcript_6318/g.14806 Transcript_6318/m.14806 type:complete len:218 (+) Transcript_6318:742-1395(+)
MPWTWQTSASSCPPTRWAPRSPPGPTRGTGARPSLRSGRRARCSSTFRVSSTNTTSGSRRPPPAFSGRARPRPHSPPRPSRRPPPPRGARRRAGPPRPPRRGRGRAGRSLPRPRRTPRGSLACARSVCWTRGWLSRRAGRRARCAWGTARCCPCRAGCARAGARRGAGRSCTTSTLTRTAGSTCRSTRARGIATLASGAWTRRRGRAGGSATTAPRA